MVKTNFGVVLAIFIALLITSANFNNILLIKPIDHNTKNAEMIGSNSDINSTPANNIFKNGVNNIDRDAFSVNKKNSDLIENAANNINMKKMDNNHNETQESDYEQYNNIPNNTINWQNNTFYSTYSTSENIDHKISHFTSVSHYEEDIAGGSWVDTFNDDSGFNRTLSDQMNIFNGDIKIKPVMINNSEFEYGTIGKIPDDWSMETLDIGTGTFIREIKLDKNRYYDGRRSVFCSSEALSDGTQNSHDSKLNLTMNDYINTQGADKVIVFISNITAKHSESWGWNCRIRIIFEDENSSYSRQLFWDGQYSGGTINNYHSKRLGDDGNTWFKYVTPIPESINKSKMKIKMKVVGACWTVTKNTFGKLSCNIDSIYLDGPQNITIISKNIIKPGCMVWDKLLINNTQPEKTYLNITILNATNNQPIPGNLSNDINGEFDISYIDPIIYTAIKLKADLMGNFSISPILHYWCVSWNATNAWRDSLFGASHQRSQNLTFGDGEVWLNCSPINFYRYSNNPILPNGSKSSWDYNGATRCSIVFNGTGYMMWYSGLDSDSVWSVGLATSQDGYYWLKYRGNPVLNKSSGSKWDNNGVGGQSVIYDGSIYKMWFQGKSVGGKVKIGYATSIDGMIWDKYEKNPILDVGSKGSWDEEAVYSPNVYYDGTKYRMYFTGQNLVTNIKVGYAESYDCIHWTKYKNNPILTGPSGSGKGSKKLFVLPRFGEKYGWYTNDNGTEIDIHMASSADGISWVKYTNNPILIKGLSGQWDQNAVYAPEILYKNRQYHMYYTGKSGSEKKIGLAISKFIDQGSISSSKINISIPYVFETLLLNKSEPTNTSINVSIIDAKTGNYIPGFTELKGKNINISSLNLKGYSSIILRANFTSDGNATPVLYNWAVTWRKLPALKLSPGGPYIVNEGSPVKLTCNCTTLDYLLSFQYHWDLDNDGKFDTKWSSTPDHTKIWYDDHSGFVKVQVQDNFGRTAVAYVRVLVNNVAPTVNIGNNMVVPEWTTVHFNGSFTDPGTLDTHNITWDLGDGNNSYGTLTPSHHYPQPGVFNVVLVVRDDDNGFGKDNLTVTVYNVLPLVYAGEDIYVNEGANFWLNGTITNPGHDSLTYYWDFDIYTDGPDQDNITDNDMDSTKLNISYIIMDNGTFVAKLTVIDDDNSVVYDHINITINDRSPHARAGTDQWTDANTNLTFNASGSYSYPDKIVKYHWDFGDGSNSSGLLVNHSYSKYGIYTVTLTVWDDDGSFDVDTALVYVNETRHWCGYIAYEDLKNQKYCDYDYNDWGMLMHVQHAFMYNGNITSLHLEFAGMLKLAGFDHKVFIGINISGEVGYNWDVKHYDASDTMFWHRAGYGIGDLNITLFNCTGKNVGYSVKVDISFNNTIAPSNLAPLPFDPYMYVFNTREWIHLGCTQMMSVKDASGSNPFIGKNETPLVLVVELEGWTPPTECQRIWKAYPYFDDWIYSKRTKYLDWYKYTF